MIWHNVNIRLVSASLKKSDLNYEAAYILVLWVR
jgi:hypothetical protein